MDIQPSLVGARARIQRAEEHFSQLERDVPKDGAVYFAPFQIGTKIDTTNPINPIEDELSIIVGEIIYNLRSALDYLVFEVALLDSQKEQKNTQFPIVREEKDWPEQVKSRLRGVSTKHIKCIETYQPFRGCEWTGTLNEISNPDKHRRLTLLLPGLIRLKVPSPVPVKIETPSLCFDNGDNVLGCLKELIEETTDTIESFKAEFP